MLTCLKGDVAATYSKERTVGDSYPRIKVAAVQAAPVFLDREATVQKACRLIREAGAAGARVIGFPEGFLPGHPLWFHFFPATGPESQRMSTELFKNSVEIPSPATDALAAAARDAGAYVVMGMCERRAGTTGTMYNTQVFFDPLGRIMGRHRKLTPTSGERIVHMGGDGDTLGAFAADFGKLSGLICGENSNPLAVFALAAESTMVHVASWPSIGRRGNLSRSDRASMTGRAFAMMTKAYVLNVCGTLSDEMREMLAYTAEDRTFLDNLAVTGARRSSVRAAASSRARSAVKRASYTATAIWKNASGRSSCTTWPDTTIARTYSHCALTHAPGRSTAARKQPTQSACGTPGKR